MRFLIGALLFVLLMPGANAQNARVEMYDGTVILGELVEVTDTHVRLKVDSEVLEIPIDVIQDFSEVRTPPVTEDPPGTETPPGTEDPPGTGTPPVTEAPTVPPPAAPGSAAPVTPPTAVSRPRASSDSLFYQRLGWIPQRYSWAASESAATTFSLLLITFLALGTSIHIGTAVAGVEFRSFSRACGMSFLVMVIGAAEVGFVPANPIAVGVAVLGSLVAWMLLSKVLFQARGVHAFIGLMVTAMCMGVAVVVVETVEILLGMVDAGIAREW